MLVQLGLLHVSAAEKPDAESCPVGTYDIGRDAAGSPVCKSEPSGCPYGDSIPLDSPKCTPPVDYSTSHNMVIEGK